MAPLSAVIDPIRFFDLGTTRWSTQARTEFDALPASTGCPARDVEVLDVPVDLAFDQALFGEAALAEDIERQSQAVRHRRFDMIPRSRISILGELERRRRAALLGPGFEEFAFVRDDDHPGAVAHDGFDVGQRAAGRVFVLADDPWIDAASVAQHGLQLVAKLRVGGGVGGAHADEDARCGHRSLSRRRGSVDRPRDRRMKLPDIALRGKPRSGGEVCPWSRAAAGPGRSSATRRLFDWMRAMDKRVPLLASAYTGAAVLRHAASWVGWPPRPIIRHSAGWPSTDRACCGTASRAGSTPESTSPRRGYRPAPTSASIWSLGSPVARLPKPRSARPNTTGIAIRRRRSSIPGRPACRQEAPPKRGRFSVVVVQHVLAFIVPEVALVVGFGFLLVGHGGRDDGFNVEKDSNFPWCVSPIAKCCGRFVALAKSSGEQRSRCAMTNWGVLIQSR